MGCGSSTPIDQVSTASQSIDAQLKKDKIAHMNEVKLLLLGSGEGGKSTVLRQFQLINGKIIDDSERLDYKEVIYLNTLQSMQVVCEAFELLGKPFPQKPELIQAGEFLLNLEQNPPVTNSDSDFKAEIAQPILTLWKSQEVKDIMSLSNQFQLNDSANYFFDALERISAAGYIPNDQDILRARIKTTGIKEVKFTVGKLNYRVCDVGGQRSERKKWIHCFEGVNVVLFVIALSEFNQKLYEDQAINRLDESMVLWQSIVESRWFANSNIILFLNKIDLFEEKLRNFQLKDFSSDYTGDNSFKSACQYMQEKFVPSSISQKRIVYTHFTQATDKQQLKPVFAAVADQILAQNLRAVGML